MRFKKRVLCFGKDRSLLNTRQWLLDLLFRTTSVMSLTEIEDLAASSSFDLLILCHTLTSDECHAASAIARQHWPKVKILGLTALHPACDPPDTDAVIAGLEGPEMLLECASQMLQAA